MALKFQKPALEVEVSAVIEPVSEMHKVLVDQAMTDVEALTAEFIELHKKYEYFEVKALVKRMDEVRKQLVAIANETVDPNMTAAFACSQGKVVFSERGKVTEIPNPLFLVQNLLQKFGPDVTASVVDIAITPLRKLLSEYELKEHVKEQPGSRTLKGVLPAG